MTTTTTAERNRWYPCQPPGLDGENDDTYTDRLTGADRTGREPYDHPRNRQCSIGWHSECSDPAGARCKCPCHAEADTGVAADPVTEAAGVKLAELYDLPDATGRRVMVMAAVRCRTGLPAAAVRGGLAVDIAAAYGSRVTNDFLTDVMNVYRAAADGGL